MKLTIKLQKLLNNFWVWPILHSFRTSQLNYVRISHSQSQKSVSEKFRQPGRRIYASGGGATRSCEKRLRKPKLLATSY
jgi:hypothetical protein